jgi:hypothetical protein
MAAIRKKEVEDEISEPKRRKQKLNSGMRSP